MVINNGASNRRNTHYWSDDNPHLTKGLRHQSRYGFNIRAAVCGRTIIGPLLYHNNLTTERYLHLLQNDLENALDNLPLAQIRDCWMQQDGASAHNSRPVRGYLSMKFPEKVISTLTLDSVEEQTAAAASCIILSSALLLERIKRKNRKERRWWMVSIIGVVLGRYL
nr:unnamed protein product [Callosobruchus analis]